MGLLGRFPYARLLCSVPSSVISSAAVMMTFTGDFKIFAGDVVVVAVTSGIVLVDAADA